MTCAGAGGAGTLRSTSVRAFPRISNDTRRGAWYADCGADIIAPYKHARCACIRRAPFRHMNYRDNRCSVTRQRARSCAAPASAISACFSCRSPPHLPFYRSLCLLHILHSPPRHCTSPPSLKPRINSCAIAGGCDACHPRGASLLRRIMCADHIIFCHADDERACAGICHRLATWFAACHSSCLTDVRRVPSPLFSRSVGYVRDMVERGLTYAARRLFRVRRRHDRGVMNDMTR